MTTQTQKTIRFNVSKSTGWKDAFVVSCLAIVLGAFVAQISSTPKHSSGSAADGVGLRDRLHERLASSGGQPHGGR